jgi:c-di-GMP-related signal transduction protein
MSEPFSARAKPGHVKVPAHPAPDAQGAAEAPFVYLGRQPILDRDGALNAYELLFRASAHNYAEVSDDAQATAQVVARTIGGIGVSAVLGHHRGYVNIGRDLLFDDIVHLMSPERFVLEILETVSFDARLVRRLGELRRAGFQVALDDVSELTDGLRAVLPHSDIVKIDFLVTPREALPELAAAVLAEGKTLIAEKVETREDFAVARDLSFHLFQGYFFARPQMLAAPRNRSSRPALLRLLALLASDAGIIELEAELKRNPNVVVQLLRLVNSSAFGLGRNIASLREAIIATGTRQIARWAQLLLYADGGDLPWRSDPLVHVVLGTTPAEALDKLGLASQIRDAIVEHGGALGALLRIAAAADQCADERTDAASIAASADAPAGFEALTPEVLAELNLSAAAWFGAHAGME